MIELWAKRTFATFLIGIAVCIVCPPLGGFLIMLGFMGFCITLAIGVLQD